MEFMNNQRRNLTRHEREILLGDLTELELRRRRSKLFYFPIHPWQLEFIEKTSQYRECLASKANRIGGTILMAVFATVWMTGRYEAEHRMPDGKLVKGINFPWKGRKFDGPTRGLIVGSDLSQMRGASQRLLMGDGKPWGEGPPKDLHPIMPFDALLDQKITMHSDARLSIDSLRVRHISGDYSTCFFVGQRQDWRKFMGDEFDWVLNDEFPDNYKMYTQELARTSTSLGPVLTFATPEGKKGADSRKIIERFLHEKPKNPDTGEDLTWYRFIHLNEALHIPPKTIRQIKVIERLYPGRYSKVNMPERRENNFLLCGRSIITCSRSTTMWM